MVFIVIVVFPALIMAQTGSSPYPVPSSKAPPYQPAVPPPSMINGYGYGGGPVYGGGTTAAGSAMNGMASVISAKGNYNLSTSAAAVNMTQAQKNEIQNHQLYTNTYFDMRATNKAAARPKKALSRRWSKSREWPATARPIRSPRRKWIRSPAK